MGRGENTTMLVALVATLLAFFRVPMGTQAGGLPAYTFLPTALLGVGGLGATLYLTGVGDVAEITCSSRSADMLARITPSAGCPESSGSQDALMYWNLVVLLRAVASMMSTEHGRCNQARHEFGLDCDLIEFSVITSHLEPINWC